MSLFFPHKLSSPCVLLFLHFVCQIFKHVDFLYMACYNNRVPIVQPGLWREAFIWTTP